MRCPTTSSWSARVSPAPSSCNAYTELGVTVTVVASRDRVLPYEDADAALVLEESFAERGVRLFKNARAQSVTRTDDGVLVTMTDGRTVEGSHALMTIGSVPNTSGLGLERVGIELGARRLPDRGPGVADIGARYLCRRGLHRSAAAGLGRRHAGPDRDVSRAGGGRQPDPVAHRRGDGVHPARDRGGRRPAVGDRRRLGAGPHHHAAVANQCAGQDVGAASRLRQALLPAVPPAW